MVCWAWWSFVCFFPSMVSWRWVVSLAWDWTYSCQKKLRSQELKTLIPISGDSVQFVLCNWNTNLSCSTAGVKGCCMKWVKKAQHLVSIMPRSWQDLVKIFTGKILPESCQFLPSAETWDYLARILGKILCKIFTWDLSSCWFLACLGKSCKITHDHAWHFQ